MSKTPKARDWVYRFTYDDVVSVLGFDPDLDQLAVITKALDNSQMGEEFYTAVAGCVEEADGYECDECEQRIASDELIDPAHADWCSLNPGNVVDIQAKGV